MLDPADREVLWQVVAREFRGLKLKERVLGESSLGGQPIGEALQIGKVVGPRGWGALLFDERLLKADDPLC